MLPKTPKFKRKYNDLEYFYYLPKIVWTNAAIGQSMLFRASPSVKAPIMSKGKQMHKIERSLTTRFINIKLNFVVGAWKNKLYKYEILLHSLI